jgi:hypothetical protein
LHPRNLDNLLREISLNGAARLAANSWENSQVGIYSRRFCSGGSLTTET